VSGDDSRAKATVIGLLQSFGWRDIIDPGDISAALGTKHFLPLWLRLWGAKNTGLVNIEVVV
jgi:predicted dinucleotide-binding enzyme